MTLLEAINRKSTVKVFQNRRVGDEIFRGILKFSETLQLPFSPDDVNLEVLDSCGEIRKQMGVKAPYFLFIYTKNPENGSLNAGFAAEQLSCICGRRDLEAEYWDSETICRERTKGRVHGNSAGFWMAPEQRRDGFRQERRI